MNSDGDTIILHISDLHRTPGSELSNADLWGSIRNDIVHGYAATNRNLEHGQPRLPTNGEIDLIVLSGDVTQQASLTEYAEGAEFLAKLVDELLAGDRQRLVIVPGNHDVDWDLSRASYREIRQYHSAQLRAAHYQESKYRFAEEEDSTTRVLMERKRDDLYAHRFQSFATFFNQFYSGAHTFPLEETSRQFTVFDRLSQTHGIVLVGFSSCYCTDHLWRRGMINREAILNASEELDKRGHTPDSTLRVAVWHHNLLGSPEQPDFMDPRVAVLLAETGFHLGLHGHVHQAGRLDFLGSHARLPVVWAGSFCAGSRERPPSTPMLYNIVGLNPKAKSGWTHVRGRKSEYDGWGAFYDWGSGHNCWYPLELGGPSNAPAHRGHAFERYGVLDIVPSMTQGKGSAASVLGTVDHSFWFMGIAARKWIDTNPLLEQVVKRVGSRTKPTKFLLLDPASEHAERLSLSQHGDSTTLSDQIKESLLAFKRFRAKGYQVEVRLYSFLPIYRIALVDESAAYLGFYRSATSGDDSPQLVLQRRPKITFLQPFLEYFEDVWNNHSQVPEWERL